MNNDELMHYGVLGTKTMNEMKNADGTNAARRYFEDIFSNT